VRTTLAAAVAVGIALVLGGVALVATLDRSLRAGVKSTLEPRLSELVSGARAGTLPDPVTIAGQPAALIQVIDASGRVVAASPTYTDEPPIGPFRALGSSSVSFTRRATSDDELYQVMGMSTTTPSGPMTIYAASSLETTSDSVTRLKTELAIGLPLLLAIVVATCWVIVGRALRPVEAIRTQVAQIGSGALDRRVPETSVEDEIGRLARTMNEMLGRLQASSERQRRFVADASHELRSPLASLRTQIEVDHAYPSQDGERGDTRVSNQLAELDRMESLVSDLLLLARVDERKLRLRSGLVPLDQIVREEAKRVGTASSMVIDTSRVRPTTLRGDADALTRVVGNLLDNAGRYAGSRVDVVLRASNEQVRFAVADDGPGIPVEARERVFERFRRLDEGRSRSSGGAGLGLAIVRSIVHAHGGTVRVEERGSGACFVVLLPVEPTQPRDT